MIYDNDIDDLTDHVLNLIFKVILGMPPKNMKH